MNRLSSRLLGVVSASRGNGLRDGYAYGRYFRQAAGVVDQHSHGDRVAAFSRHQPRQVVADWRVEPDLTALDLLQDRGGGEGLGDAADAVPHFGSNGMAGVDIGNAGGAAPYLVAVAHFSEHSRHARAMDLVYGRVQLRGIEWVLHYMYPLVVNLFLTTSVRALVGIFRNRHFSLSLAL